MQCGRKTLTTHIMWVRYINGGVCVRQIVKHRISLNPHIVFRGYGTATRARATFFVNIYFPVMRPAAELHVSNNNVFGIIQTAQTFQTTIYICTRRVTSARFTGCMRGGTFYPMPNRVYLIWSRLFALAQRRGALHYAISRTTTQRGFAGS